MLNKAQREAVDVPLKCGLQILAGPGTGKTHTLTSRIAKFIQDGVPAETIVVMTFTKKAAEEMKDRLEKICGEKAKGIILGTFHSVCLKYLKSQYRLFTIIDDTTQQQIINKIMLDDEFHAMETISKKALVKRMMGLKAHGTEPSEGPQDQRLRYLFRAYQRELSATNGMDFDDIIVKTRDLIESSPCTFSSIQAVFVDEFQDTSQLQLDLLLLLSRNCESLTVVGDPDQSIYSWRYAYPQNFEEMIQRRPNTVVVKLEENYRSTQGILNYALALINQDADKRHVEQKRLRSVKSFNDRNLLPLPTMARFHNDTAESTQIASLIQFLHFKGIFAFGDFAILARRKSLFSQLESALRKEGIPYKIVGGNSFFQNPIVRTFLNYLRVIFNPMDKYAIEGSINCPARGIGEKTLKKILSFEGRQDKVNYIALIQEHMEHLSERIKAGCVSYMSLLNRCQDIMCGEATSLELCKDLIQLISKVVDKDEQSKSLKTFISILMDELSKLAIDEPHLTPTEMLHAGVLQFTTSTSEIIRDELTGGQQQTDTTVVSLSTIHAAKGLEWPVVFNFACVEDDDELKTSRAHRVQSVTPNKCLQQILNDEAAEQRRVMFVALTRAKVLSFVTMTKFVTEWGSATKRESKILTCLKNISEDLTSENSLQIIKRPTESQLVQIAKFLGREYHSEIQRKLGTRDIGKRTTAFPGFVKASSLPVSNVTQSRAKEKVEKRSLQKPKNSSSHLQGGRLIDHWLKSKGS